MIMKKKSIKSAQKILNKSILVFLSLTMLCAAAWIQENSSDEVTFPSSGQDALFYSNQTGDNLEGIYTSAIEKAQKSVLLMIFSMTNEKVIQAIRQKSEEGIPVKVICDAKASPNIIRKLGPKVDVLRRFGKGLMHLKILVVDEQDCWLGSANLTGESLSLHGNLVLGISDESLANVIQKKADCLLEYDRDGDILQSQHQIGNQKLELSFLPDDTQGITRIKQLIRSAQKSIRVAMFTFTRYDLAKELINARDRGVDVEVVLDRNQSKGAGAKIAEIFEAEQMNISYSKGSPLLHHKFMYIDDKTLEIGSANWTKAAFNSNDDCFLILHDLTEKQTTQMNNLWEVIKAESSYKKS